MKVQKSRVKAQGTEGISSFNKFFPYHFYFLSITFFLFPFTFSCNFPENVNLNIDSPSFTNLSEYHFFTGEIKNLNPNVKVLPYDLINPLFSDYAEKIRFVWMPENTSALYNDSNVFEFPLGTVLIKNFYFPNDFRKISSTPHSSGEDSVLRSGEAKIIETRLLIKRKNGWDALAYIWNEDQTDALLEVAGGEKKIIFIDKSGNKIDFDYSIPNKNQCKSCHTNKGQFQPIGPKAKNLNKIFSFKEGGENQLAKWKEVGYLKGFPNTGNVPKLPKWNDSTTGTLEQRALAYLEANCAHCHSPEGPAATSGLFLSSIENNSSHLGICKSPVAAGKGTGGFLYDIVPGKPDESILFYRIISTDPGVMMPELGRKLAHQEGVDLVRQWITSLKGNCFADIRNHASP